MSFSVMSLKTELWCILGEHQMYSLYKGSHTPAFSLPVKSFCTPQVFIILPSQLQVKENPQTNHLNY